MKQSIAILYDCAYPFIQGGGQKRLYKIAQHLLKQGYHVDWFTLKSWEGPNQLQRDGITFIAVGKQMELYNPNGKRSLRQALYYGICIAKQMPRLAKYSILHAGQWPYFHLFPAKIVTFLNRKIFMIDWWETWDKEWRHYAGKKSFLGRTLERIACRLSHRLITISELGKQQLYQIRKPHPQIAVIHNGIDFTAIQNINKAGTPTDLCYLGRLKNHKNIDLLLHAIALLKQQNKIVTASIIGDGPEKLYLIKLAEQLNIQTQVHFLGQINDDQDAYAQMKSAKIFIHPSTKEGGGSITTLEANACDLPVIAFLHPNGISPEFIREGQNGCWVKQISAAALADAIANLLNDGNKLSHMQRHAVEFVRQFAWENIGAKYVEFLHKFINNK